MRPNGTTRNGRRRPARASPSGTGTGDFPEPSLGGLGDLFPAQCGDLGDRPRAALVELRQPTLRVRLHDIALRSRVLLRTDPAVRGDVEDDAIEVGVLDLIAVRVVRVAH